MVEINQLIEKLDEYLQQIEDIANKSYRDGEKERNFLNENIRNFIRRVFPDAQQRMFEYEGTCFASGRQHSERELQDKYIEKLERMKKFLLGYKEELEFFGLDFSKVCPTKPTVETELKGGIPSLFQIKRTTKQK